MPTLDDLRQRQSLPLDVKIAMSEVRIAEWVREYGVTGCYISFSGGKDSTVLLHIARRLYPDMQAVFVDTGLEFPELKEHVKTFENVETLRPEMSFKSVITKYGYPVISKNVAHNVSVARRNPDGKLIKRYFDPEFKSLFTSAKYVEMINVDFLVSDKCCAIMKKSPIAKYEKTTGRHGITAQMACESKTRLKNWLQHGCNAFDQKKPVSNPLSFWRETDILEYVKRFNIKIPSVYGDIIPVNNQLSFCDECELCTTGYDRTGCVFCGFGAHLENGEGRFVMLKRTHPKLYDYCINGGEYGTDGLWRPSKNGLGMGHVFDVINNLYGTMIPYK